MKTETTPTLAAIKRAAEHLDNALADLTTANSSASPIEHMLILDLIAEVAADRIRAHAIASAIANTR